jgi:23S rRNA pseudouridine955/2504/2580 synthase
MSYDSNPDSPASTPRASHVKVAEGDDGQRLDNWLMRALKGLPRSRVYRLLRKGEVRVNGKRAKPDQRVAAGDDVRLPPIRPVEAEGEGAPPRIRKAPSTLIDTIEQAIIHADDDLLVIAKPSGLAVHGGSGLSFGVIEALRASRPHEELELAHRLDRDTSGLLLVARNRPALRVLHGLLREGLVEKHYLTLVKGSWNLGTKTIDAPLDTEARRAGERVVRVQAAGKAATTTFVPVDFFGARASLLSVELGTGRTHQIRVHAGYAGHPVAGDDKYGDHAFNADMKLLGLRRLFLHAQSLSFEWPRSRKNYAFNQPLPEDLATVVDQLAATRRRKGEGRSRPRSRPRSRTR